jgi:hypothetical protein
MDVMDNGSAEDGEDENEEENGVPDFIALF